MFENKNRTNIWNIRLLSLVLYDIINHIDTYAIDSFFSAEPDNMEGFIYGIWKDFQETK